MRVLIVSLLNPFGLARLPRALGEAGFEVALLSPTSSVTRASRHVVERFAMPPVRSGVPILLALISAMQRYRPEFVIPGDDPAVRFLQRAVETAPTRRWPTLPPAALAVLERSLGDRASYPLLPSISRTTKLVRDLGVLVPPVTPFTSLQEALACVPEYGYPIVVKFDFSDGGIGVAILNDEAELREAIEDWFLSRPNTRRRLTMLARRLMLDDLAESWHPEGVSVCVQKHIKGSPMNYCGVAVQGRLLAGFSVRAEQTDPPEMGASTVLRFVQNDALDAAAAALAPALGYTGFFGLDFVEDASGTPYFLEINPRSTPATYLGARVGVDLCKALAAGLQQREYRPSGPAAAGSVGSLVALFPQEWIREPTGAILHTTDHDVPWDDPDLVSAYVREAQRVMVDKAKAAAAEAKRAADKGKPA